MKKYFKLSFTRIHFNMYILHSMYINFSHVKLQDNLLANRNQVKSFSRNEVLMCETRTIIDSKALSQWPCFTTY